MRLVSKVLFTALCVAVGSTQATDPSVALAPQINAADFAQFDKTLSSDAFGGRKPGTAAEPLTTNWLVEQYKRMGLQPGNHGSWFQTVPADSTQLVNTDVTLDISAQGKETKLAYRTDMIVETLQAKAAVDLKNSPIVFLGFGADAPQWHWNDYKDIDVKGKTVIVLVNDPGFATLDPKLFNGRAMTYYGRWTYKYAEAALKGAAACFIVHTSDAAAGYPWTVIKNSGSGPQLSLPSSVDPSPRLPVAGWLTRDAATRLFAAAGQDFDKLEKDAAKPGFKPVPLQATVSVSLKNKIGHIESHNVLAMVKGSSKPDEAVIYTAHWDHLGTDPSLKGHQVYSGAIDNGTGLTMLLELADAFAHQKTPPQRSVLFFMPTLEESGLLGSQYYASKPVFALDKTVADIAVDALPIIGRAHDMTVIGKGQSQLEDMLADVLKSQGRVISPETTPENGFYFRSDHFNFAKVGVPAMLASSGLDLLNGGRDAGQKAASDYTAHHYHTPNDVFDPNWDYSGILEDTQALYELGQKLSEDSVWPKWYADSPFGAKRASSMSKADGAVK
ncbi:M28 family metallopeptidase [Rhodanobacter sp. MP1X3]|uniref:M28 family metallopeptidase n=1 Tax=Rhodanobacter sp. MP1X3 TaxID=2723086 RepID=UPI00160A1F4E|nr:M28 family metallopeptidase [Rhodanobacter sp. MP1X3]MBB6243956.1 Zn-dependent M28 family amino/carboxypeptidase [Rhodanobacter sp. MP1X3]